MFSSSAQEWKEKTNVKDLVQEISRHSSDKTKEDFKFVMRGISTADLQKKNPEDLYNILRKRFDTSDLSDEEPTETATVFHEVCVCAGFGDPSNTDNDTDVNNTARLNNLKKFCLPGSYEDQENILKQLHYRQKLLEIGRDIIKHNALAKIVVMFKDHEHGTHPENIFTPIDLFTCLLKKSILRPDEPSSISVLEKKLRSVKGL